jgi:SAM-dependent methyltransferase
MSNSIYETGDYLARNPTYHVEDSEWKANQVLNLLRQHALSPTSVCEVGCGAGEILALLQQKMPAGVRFEGFEISPQAHALCAERANQHLRFHQADILEVKPEPFDLMMCMDVFEHVDDYLSFLKRLRERARYKIFHIPLDLSVQSVARSTPIMRLRSQVGHLHYFTKETALATLEYAGYEVVDWVYTAGANDHPGSLKARLAILPRKLLFSINPDLAVRILGGYSILALTR